MNQAVITLKAPSGQLLVGTVRGIRADTLTVEVEAPVREHAILEWRMELTGHQETVAGSLRVISVRPDPVTHLYVVMGQLDRMSPPDRERLEAWLREQQDGGTTRRYDQSVDSDVSSWTRSHHASESETRAALARLNHRRRHIQSGSEPSDLLGLTSEVRSDAGRESGRQALRDALRQSMARKRRRAAAAPSGLPSWARAQQQTGQATQPDPEVATVPHTSPQHIQVRYRDAVLYQRDFSQNISRYALSLPLPTLGESGTRLLITITPPHQRAVTCDGEVKVKMPSGVGVALMLDAHQLSRLAPED
jgi:hypothetical protein